MSAAAQLALDLGHRSALGREDFLIAPSNAEAVSWIDRWPDWPGPCLVLHGPEGSGKTHLASVWCATTGAALIEGGVLDAVGAVSAVADGARCFVVEGAEDATDDRALLALFNTLAEAGGHLLVTAREPPSRWQARLPDLMSRLRAAQTTALAPPDDALMAALLVKQFDDRQVAVPADVVSYLVTRIERSSGAARRIVDEIDRAALAGKRKVSVALAREVIRRGP